MGTVHSSLDCGWTSLWLSKFIGDHFRDLFMIVYSRSCDNCMSCDAWFCLDDCPIIRSRQFSCRHSLTMRNGFENICQLKVLQTFFSLITFVNPLFIIIALCSNFIIKSFNISVEIYKYQALSIPLSGLICISFGCPSSIHIGKTWSQILIIW